MERDGRGWMRTLLEWNFDHQRVAFEVSGEVPPGPVLLVDDMVDSRWTLTVVGSILREAGSGPVFPFALADTVGRAVS